MLRTRHHFSPTVAMKQPIDGAVIDFVSNSFLKSLPDLPHRRDLPALRLRKKWGQEFLFFFQGEILSPSASLAGRFNRHDAETVVAGDYCMSSCCGHSTVPCNLRSRPRLDQGIVDNEPTLPPVGAGIGPHPVFHFCQGQMGCCMSYLCHVFLLLSFQPVHSSSTSGEWREVTLFLRLLACSCGREVERTSDHPVSEHFPAQESRVSHRVPTSLPIERPHGQMRFGKACNEGGRSLPAFRTSRV